MYHRTVFGRFGALVAPFADLDGYVPEEGDEIDAFCWADDRPDDWPSFVVAAGVATDEASTAVDEWRDGAPQGSRQRAFLLALEGIAAEDGRPAGRQEMIARLESMGETWANSREVGRLARVLDERGYIEAAGGSYVLTQTGDGLAVEFSATFLGDR